MIKQIINLLMTGNHYGESETIEIAKGKYELPKTWTRTFNQIKRDIKWMILKN